MNDKIGYFIQSPMIATMEFSSDEKRDIRDECNKIWEFFHENFTLDYAPVLTVFTEENRIRIIRTRYPGRDFVATTSRIPLKDCIRAVLTMILEFSNQIPNDFDFEKIHQLLQLDDILCSDILPIIERLIEILSSFTSKRLTVDPLDGLLHYLIEHCPLCRNQVQSNNRISDLITCLLTIEAYILDLCDQDSGDDTEPEIVRRIIEKIFTKYGCYTPPSYWDYYETHPDKLKHILIILGLWPNIHLFNLPTIFIFPQFIRSNRLKQIEKLTESSKNILRYVIALTLVHENSHALLRHGLSLKSTKKSWFNYGHQKDLDEIRHTRSYIEEGLVMYIVKEFIRLKVEDEKNKIALNKYIDNYINTGKGFAIHHDLTIWPYAGYNVITKYLRTPLKSGKTPVIMTLIEDWKEDSSKLIKELDKVAEILGYIYKK